MIIGIFFSMMTQSNSKNAEKAASFIRRDCSMRMRREV